MAGFAAGPAEEWIILAAPLLSIALFSAFGWLSRLRKLRDDPLDAKAAG